MSKYEIKKITRNSCLSFLEDHLLKVKSHFNPKQYNLFVNYYFEQNLYIYVISLNFKG
jgi:hypothetical protein